MCYSTQSQSEGQGKGKSENEEGSLEAEKKASAEGESDSAAKKDATAPPSAEEECQRKLKAKEDEVTDLTVRHQLKHHIAFAEVIFN